MNGKKWNRRVASIGCRSCVLFTAWVMLGCTLLLAEDPTAVLDGMKPADARLEKLKDLNGYFPFEVPKEVEIWNQRAEQVRTRLKVALGLFPMPTRTPLKPVIHGSRDMGDYTIEKVYFESMPGFFVTGNLYRPKKASGKMPGVICPHGHWSNGRFTDAGRDGVRKQIVNGAERFEDGGRSPLQSRCVQLARMGCVVFHYDMLGYADSEQLSYSLVHRFAKQRPEAISMTSWGLFSPQAESHAQSAMGLQSWNSIRALDFVSQLPGVDPKRLAVTGASGGGTQTFMLAALDPRVAVAMPCVMVSTAMQGGCTCENASLLRIGTGNVEFAGLFAPKAQGLTAANDWTKEMQTKGFPQLQKLYEMLGAPKNVMLASLTHFNHNYNYVSRARMYAWFNLHLKLGMTEPIVEEAHRHLTEEELTVWGKGHPKPPGGDAFERDLLKWWNSDTQNQLDQMAFGEKKEWSKYQQLVQQALQVILRAKVPESADLFDFEATRKEQQDGAMIIGGVLKYLPESTANPTLFVFPENWNKSVAIWVTGQGKTSLFEGDSLSPAVQQLVGQGVAIAGIDLFQQGEYQQGEKEVFTQQRVVANPRESAAYTYGFNDPLFARRVQDLLRLVGFVKTHKDVPEKVWLVGVDGGGHFVAAARAIAGHAVDRTCVDTEGFRFGKVDSIRHVDFLPAAARYHDLIGMLVQAAPGELWLAGEGETLPKLVARAYAQTGAPQNVSLAKDNKSSSHAAVAWLLRQ